MDAEQLGNKTLNLPWSARQVLLIRTFLRTAFYMDRIPLIESSIYTYATLRDFEWRHLQTFI